MSTRQRPSATRLELCLKALLTIYLLAAALTPLSHHDLACHFKSPTHCTTCNVGSSGETFDDCEPLISVPMADAGRADRQAQPSPISIPPGATAGRSPPVRG